MELIDQLTFNNDILVTIVFLIFLAQFLWVWFSQTKTDLWRELVAKYRYESSLEGLSSLKHLLYYAPSHNEGKVSLQFNGARYGILDRGLVVRPPIGSFGGAVLLPWDKIRIGDYATIPIDGWKFCKFKNLVVDDLNSTLVIPEELCNQISEYLG